MARVLGMTLANRSYLIHRPYFLKSLGNATFKPSYTACIQAAESILATMSEGLPPPFHRLWNITVWLVAAGLVLSLDLVQQAASNRAPASQLQQRRRRLEALVGLLNTGADQSGIAARGAKIITHLCNLDQPAAVGSPANISRADVLRLISTCRSPSRGEDGSVGSRGGEVPAADERNNILPGQNVDAFSLPMLDRSMMLWTYEWQWPEADLTSMAFGMFGAGEQDQLLDLFVNLVPEG